MNTRHLLAAAVAAALAIGTANAQFTAGMGETAIQTEINNRVKAGQSMETIAAAAFATAGLDVSVFVAAMVRLSATDSDANLITALLNAGAKAKPQVSATTILDAALTAGASPEAVRTGVANASDRTYVTTAMAESAINNSTAGATGGAGGGAGSGGTTGAGTGGGGGGTASP